MMILALALAAAPAPALSDPDLAAARAVFIDHLRDPEHAKVRNFRRVAGSSGGFYYCGEVNAPNAYGGLTGWHGVQVTAKGGFMEDPQDRSLTARVFSSLCEGAGGGDDLTSAFDPAPDQSAGR